MSQVFVKKTTGALLFLVALLSILCVALLVLLLAPDWREGLDDGQPKGSTQEPSANVAGVLSLGGKKPTTKTPMKSPTKPPTTMKPVLKEPWEKEYRIPKTTLPLHYDLYLHPDLETGLFRGRVEILIGVTAPMNFLVAHVKYMNVTKTVLETEEGASVILKDAFEYEPNQFWVSRPKRTLKPGNYTLKLDFEGNLDGHIVGFYRSVYTTKANEKRSIATSKFQPTDARRAFPCFDEPSFKSTFTVTMVRPSAGYIALSNMPVQIQVEDRPAKGLTEVVFQKSVPMVTYLVCFIVCDFESVHALTQGNKDFRVYATSDQIDRTQYALELGVNVLNFFENYFEIEYPLPKQDMIAIPDFVSGAMEHWGLITYRETNLLYDDRSSSSYNKQRVAAVVAHELAHMWFGNLVTLRWWDDLWLNEGFASYIEYKGIAHHEPDWQVEAQFVCSDLRRALDLDSQLSSHPIVQEVNHPDEITEIFDAISYSKGASVLRMLEDFMGSEDFRKGIRNFLRKYIYDNAVTQDLWTELEKTSSEHLNITRIMDSWTRQMGYPVLHVKKVGPDAVRVTQKRFLVDSEAVGDNDSPYGYVWDAAVSYRTDLTDRQQTWFYREADSVTLSIPPGSSWVKLNHDTFGYYRVNYDDALWNDLISAFRKDHTVFSPSDRAGVLDDAFNLAAAELIPYDRVFSLISYMDKEDNYVAWKPVASHLKNMGFLLKMTKAYPDYRRYVVQLVEGHVARLGSSDNGTHLERSLRPTLLSVACSHGEPRCLSQASHLLQQWLEDPSFYIPPNLRSYVYHYGMKSAGEKEWNIMLERYKAEINAQEKDKILMGLVSINSDWILQRFLDVARNESLIRTQNYQTALIRVARSGFTGAQLVWNFITAEWPWLVERYSINDRYLGRMVKYVATEFTSRQLLQRVKDFFAANPEAGAGAMSRRQALEDIEKNIKWIEKNEERLYTWLTKNHPKSR